MFCQEKIGLVLSGGGATGLAHIGVLKAIEERGIPIDYISGTSAGALIGSLYSVGFSPEEIEEFVLSESFQTMTRGNVEPYQRFAYRENKPDASMFSLSLSADSLLQKSLPTNFVASTYIDFTLLNLLGTAGASYHEDYDSLFVPFRCVSSDITNKKSIVYSYGKLNESVRASMTYPFYFKPIKVGGLLMFDGGLYNNFPADVMYNDFDPDFIIGSNVSYNASPPTEDDLISQITNMLVTYSDFSIPCEQGILIEPKTNVGTFDFASVKQAVEDGYNSALPYLDSIEKQVKSRVTKEELQQRRQKFRSKVVPIQISNITNSTQRKTDVSYISRSLRSQKKNEIIDFKTFERRYFRLNATPQIDFSFPTISLDEDSTYHLNLQVQKARDFRLDVGGHFSSRPVNTGFISLSYHTLGRIASTLSANSYFGKYYGSVMAKYDVDLPSIFPVKIGTYFTMNRWDYFRSFATFFEDVKPSFLVQNEIYTGLSFTHPIGNTTKSKFDGRFFSLEDDYYQTQSFTNKDTADFTRFNGFSFFWQFEQNTLNRKQFANSGHYASFKARYVYGFEHSVSGSTSIFPYDSNKEHSWINLRADFQTFPIDWKVFHMGLHGTAVFNSQSLFSNYTASILAMTNYAPIADMHTFFLQEYRSPQYVGIGSNVIFSIRRNIDFRFDGYYYQPFVQLTINDDGTFGYSKPFKGETFIASSSLIYNSFLGPLRATVNYFPKQEIPITFQLSFGYVLFNERAIR